MTGDEHGPSQRPASDSRTEVDRRTSGAAATGGGLAARDATPARRGLHQEPRRRIDPPSISFLVHADESDAQSDYRFLYQLILNEQIARTTGARRSIRKRRRCSQASSPSSGSCHGVTLTL